jgi:hypothetical protein
MERKIWCFGDSFTQLFLPIPGHTDWRTRYAKYKGYVPKSFSEVLAELTGCETINRGHGGADNFTIFEKIIDHIDQIAANDIIIIGWSNIARFRVANKLGSFSPVIPGSDIVLKDISKVSGMSKETLEEILINRSTNGCFVTEINKIIRLLKFSFKDNVQIHWSAFSQNDRGLDVVSIPNVPNIDQETKGEIPDLHFNEDAHVILAKHFQELINLTLGEPLETIQPIQPIVVEEELIAELPKKRKSLL